MDRWFSISALVGQPGMPGTRQGVYQRARAQNWRSRPRQGRGGGMEYCAADLPMITQVALGMGLPNRGAVAQKVREARSLLESVLRDLEEPQP